MDSTYYLEVTVEDGGQLKTHNLNEKSPLGFEAANQKAAALIMGGLGVKEEVTNPDSAVTLYSPNCIKKIRLIPKIVVAIGL